MKTLIHIYSTRLHIHRYNLSSYLYIYLYLYLYLEGPTQGWKPVPGRLDLGGVHLRVPQGHLQEASQGGGAADHSQGRPPEETMEEGEHTFFYIYP